jgi:hypothetical protein
VDDRVKPGHDDCVRVWAKPQNQRDSFQATTVTPFSPPGTFRQYGKRKILPVNSERERSMRLWNLLRGMRRPRFATILWIIDQILDGFAAYGERMHPEFLPPVDR